MNGLNQNKGGTRPDQPSKEGRIDRIDNQKSSLKRTLAENPGKNKGRMVLGGSLAVIHPKLNNVDIRFEKEAMEFDLHQEQGKDELEFNIWANLENCDVTIDTEYKDDEAPHETIFMEIADPSDRKLSLTFTANQARVIHDILERYLECYFAFLTLAETKTVKA